VLSVKLACWLHTNREPSPRSMSCTILTLTLSLTDSDSLILIAIVIADRYVPTVFENMTHTMDYHSQKILLLLWDTAGRLAI
jgi:hypothetical protein